MDIFLYNFSFLIFNSFLAIIPVSFGWLMSKADSLFAKMSTGFIWFIFLPNTIYLLTDVSHLFEDWPKVNSLFKLILIIQYSFFSIFGIITFVVSVYFFQKLLEGKSASWKVEKIRPTVLMMILVLNFLVGIAVIMGGILRTNSWYFVTDPSKVFEDLLSLIYSKDLLILSLGAGIIANLVYFAFAETIATWGKKYFTV